MGFPTQGPPQMGSPRERRILSRRPRRVLLPATSRRSVPRAENDAGGNLQEMARRGRDVGATWAEHGRSVESTKTPDKARRFSGNLERKSWAPKGRFLGEISGELADYRLALTPCPSSLSPLPRAASERKERRGNRQEVARHGRNMGAWGESTELPEISALGKLGISGSRFLRNYG